MFRQRRLVRRFGVVFAAAALVVTGLSVMALADAPSALAADTLASSPAPCASVGTPFLTLTQDVSNDPDSAVSGGDWATDAFTENVNVWVGTDGTTYCANASTAGGTFVTTGPLSPESGQPLVAGITGTFTGGENYTLPLTLNPSYSPASPQTVTLPPNTCSSGSCADGAFSQWVSQIFQGVDVNDGSNYVNTWLLTYVTANNGTWINADPASGGNSGDIGSIVNTTTDTAYPTIQAAADGAGPGQTIGLAAGIFPEQVSITQDLNLVGAGENETIIQSPSSLATSYTINGSAFKAIVGVSGGVTANISDLTVDGNGQGNSNDSFVGIGAYNASLTLNNVSVTGVSDTPISGVQDGVGIYAVNTDSVPRTDIVNNSVVMSYQKGGMVFSGGGLTANAIGDTVTGAGPTSITAQNGIQVSYGASAIISGTTVSNNDCTLANPDDNCTADPAGSDPNADGAAGILLYQAGSVTTSNDVVQNNQYGIWSVGSTSVNAQNNQVSGSGPTSSGIAIWNSDQWSEGSSVATSATITGNQLSGMGYGLLVRDYAGSGINVPAVSASGNSFIGDTTAAASNVSFNASDNWWGDVAGPGALANVTTQPWCTDSACVTTSDNDDLIDLSLSSGSLSPSFSPSTTSYATSVGSGTTSINVSATASAGTTTTITGGSSLNVGNNSITVTVTSADGTATKTYTVTVNVAVPSTTTASPPPVATTVPPVTTTTPTAPIVPPLPPGAPTATYGQPTSVTTQANASTTVVASSGGSSASVSVPTGALPPNTVVSVRTVTNAAALSAAAPADQAYVVSFAVSWEAPNGSTPTASAPITMVITDPSIKAGDTVYEITTSGLKDVGQATEDGSVTITFTADPAFVVTAAPKLTLDAPNGQLVGSHFKVKVSCTSGRVCSGVAQASVARKATNGLTHVVLAQANFSVAANKTATISLRLTSTGKQMLAPRAFARIRMSLLVKLPGGVRSVTPVYVLGRMPTK